VPSTSNELETAGGEIGEAEVEQMLADDRVLCLGEVMNFQSLVAEPEAAGVGKAELGGNRGSRSGECRAGGNRGSRSGECRAGGNRDRSGECRAGGDEDSAVDCFVPEAAGA